MAGGNGGCSGQLNLTSVDFISATTGWAVGADVLLATSDGGAHWAARPEPCLPSRSVHFISPDAGFAVAGGLSPRLGWVAGVVASSSGAGQFRQRLCIVFTDDAGRTWHVQYAGPAVRYG
jgi:photosystem II stability/assembly factor-like uncharacterized protein